MLLREAPLEIRWKAIREIPLLIRMLAEGAPRPCHEPAPESSEASGAASGAVSQAEPTAAGDVAEDVSQQMSLFA
jgi:hypothetical protein